MEIKPRPVLFRMHTQLAQNKYIYKNTSGNKNVCAPLEKGRAMRKNTAAGKTSPREKERAAMNHEIGDRQTTVAFI